MKEISQEINAKFLELGVEIPLEDIEERLDKMINKFKVPKEEARMTSQSGLTLRKLKSS